MDRTAMPFRQLVLLIVLAALLAVAGGVAVNMGSPDNAEAQSEPLTWHTIYLGDWPAEDQIFDGKPMRGTAFVDQLPAECDLFVSPHDDKVFYYSCPMDWEPVRP